MLLYVFSLLTILISYYEIEEHAKNENWQKKKKKTLQKMVVGKKKSAKKVWPVKKKSAKIVGRQKILVT